ncbi:MAG: urease accessory UreF family protein [Ilumatobacteraceae bacterium]|nr:urease accessory UreF family protein [Ilumatobacteraceae bacterium]
MNPSVLLLADGRFPAGGHAYSAGVESAVDVGDVHDLASLDRYLDGRLALGVVEAAFAVGAVGAAGGRLDLLDAEFDARVLSPRLRTVSRRLGRQLARAASAVWPDAELSRLASSVDGPHQPVALGVAVGACGGSPADAASISLHHLAAAACTAGVRLLGLDPLAVAAVQARALDRHIVSADVVERWSTTSPGELPALGGTLTELLGERHGEWDARLFVA